jgi:hypothetical protein
MNGQKGYISGDVLIRFTEDQVRILPSGVRAALDQLIAELRAAGSSVPVTENLAVIAEQIDESVNQAAAARDPAVLAPGTHLRTALELRADELRIRDVLPSSSATEISRGTCGVIFREAQAPPWALVGDSLVIFSRSLGDDPSP